jgi:hypothetical protein
MPEAEEDDAPHRSSFNPSFLSLSLSLSLSAGNVNCPAGQVGTDLRFTAVVGAEYIIQVTGDNSTESGLYRLLLKNLELNQANPFIATEVSSTYTGADNGRGRRRLLAQR